MENIKRHKKRNIRQLIFIYGGITWAVIHFLVFWVYINLSTVYNSFFSLNIKGELQWNNFSAYKEVFRILGGQKENGMASITSLWNTLSIIGLALFINLPITLLFSYMIFVKIRGVKFFKIGLYIPCVLSTVILCLFFKIMFSGEKTYHTSIYTLLKHFGYNNQYVIGEGAFASAETAWPVILFVFSIWTGVNGNIIYFNSAMARLPSSVIESAELDGASQMRQFTSIVIPMIWPVITTMSVTLIGGGLGWFQPVQLIIGEAAAAHTKTGTIAWMIVSQVKGGATVGFPAALGVVVSIVAAIFIVIFRWLMDKVYTEVEY